MRFVWPGAGPVAVRNNMRAALGDCVVCALRLLLAACATRVFFFSNPTLPLASHGRHRHPLFRRAAEKGARPPHEGLRSNTAEPLAAAVRAAAVQYGPLLNDTDTSHPIARSFF